MESRAIEGTKQLVTIDVSDVRAIRLECMGCSTTIECSPKDMKLKALTCPNCGKLLLLEGDSPGSTSLRKLVEALTLLRSSGELATEGQGKDDPGRCYGKIRLVVAVLEVV